jgi:hypothetical protein
MCSSDGTSTVFIVNSVLYSSIVFRTVRRAFLVVSRAASQYFPARCLAPSGHTFWYIFIAFLERRGFPDQIHIFILFLG